MKNRTVWITNSLLVMGIMMLLLTACFYGDAQQTVETQKLSLPIGQYSYVTWLHPDSLIVKYLPPPNPGKTRHMSKFNFYAVSLSDGTWDVLLRPALDNCVSVFPGWTARRSDGVLVATFECNQNIDSYDFMYTWDQVLKTWHEIHTYPANFKSAQFSFAPDNRQLAQGQAKGFQQEIYRVTPGQGQARILPLPDSHIPSRYSKGERQIFARRRMGA